MKRRLILRMACLGGLIEVAGCLDNQGSSELDPGTDNQEPNESDPGTDNQEPNESDPDEQKPEEQEFPDHPGELDADDVRNYVDSYEEVYQYNANLQESLSTTRCNTVLDHEMEKGIFVSSDCIIRTSGEGSSGTEYSEPVLYLVTPDETRRVDPKRSARDDTYGGDDRPSGMSSDYGVWMANFDDQGRELSLRVTHQTDDGPVTVLEEMYDLPAEGGIHLLDVTSNDGSYELHAEIEGGPEATGTFDVPNDSASITWKEGIIGGAVVTPDGDLQVRQIQLPDERDFS